MNVLLRNSIRTEDGTFIGATCARHCRLSSERGDYVNHFFDVCVGEIINPSINHEGYGTWNAFDVRFTLAEFKYFEGGHHPNPCPKRGKKSTTCKDELYLINPDGMVFGRIRERQRPVDGTLYLDIHQPIISSRITG